MIEALIYGFLGVIFTLFTLFSYWEYCRRRRRLIIDDPTDDEEYKKIARQLKCPDCYSTDFRFEEVSDLAWIQGEDRFCVCNKCGRRFGDGK